MLAFREFTYVTTIAELGSFSAAAQTLFISQPSLSQYISKLENTLGFHIFDRTTKPLKLTYLGEQYLLFASDILNRKKSFFEMVGEINGLHSGHITLGVSFYRSLYYVPKLFPPFYAKYPGVSIKLLEESAPTLEKAVLRGAADLAIINSPVHDDMIAYERLVDEKILLAIPDGHKLCEKLVWRDGIKYPEIDPHVLIDTPFIVQPTNFAIRDVTDNICSEAGFTPKIALVTHNLGTGHNLVMQGIGVTVIPETIIFEEGHPKRPIYATFAGKDPVWPIIIVYHRNRYLTPAMKAFIALSKEVMQTL